MSEKIIRVGILGCANIARRSVIPAFIKHSLFRVVAIASRSSEKAQLAAKDYMCRFCSYEELVVDPQVDLIYCPLPTGLHYKWVRKSLLAGKHVLCEKSLGCNAREVSDLVGIARSKNLFLMESFQFRFHEQNLYVKALLAKNAIGPLRQLVVRFGIPPFLDGVQNIRYSKALGGGALLDNGAYTIKCATYFLGPQIKPLAAIESGATAALGGVNIIGSMMLVAQSTRALNPTSSLPICVHTSYGFDNFYQNGYEIWGANGKITTKRAFTARDDFAAPVIVETSNGEVTKTFCDDHFLRLMDHVAHVIMSGDFAAEYDECMTQARILQAVAEMGVL